MKESYLRLTIVISLIITIFVITSNNSFAYYDDYYTDCEHDYIVTDVSDDIVNFECSKCKQQKSGYIPSEVYIYPVSSIYDDGITYGYSVPEEFTPGETITIYAAVDYVEYPEIEVSASDNEIVKINKIEHKYYDTLYTLEFLKEGAVTITVTSKYDSSIEYETLTFKSICEHNFEIKDVKDYVVSLECSKCKETKSGNIPSNVWLYDVDEFNNSGITYSSYIPSSFNKGQNMTIYAEKSYAEYSEIEFLTLNNNILKIERIPHDYYELYSFKFLQDGVATVVVTSKYDNSIVYDVLTFVAEGYDSYLAGYLSYTGEKDRAGDIDGDGKITVSDARLILRLSINLCDCNMATKQYADANGNGKITVADARFVLRVAVSLTKESELSEFYVLKQEYYDSYYNNTETISLKVGDKYSTDKYIIRGQDNITYTSSNPAVATVDKYNRIKALKKGYTCITATNGKETFTYEVFVLEKNDKLENYIYGNQSISLGINDTIAIEYVVLKDTKNIKWKSSNPAVATVDNKGNVKAIKKGYACIIATSGNESCYYDVNVKNALQEKIDLYREKYPDGYYWNNHTPSKKYPYVTEQPCTDHQSGTYAYCKGQCAGFAALMYNEIYGNNAKKNYGVTWSTIEIGDYIRLNPHHSIFITDVVKKGDIIGYDTYSGKNITASEDYVVVVHCNWGSCCNIAWDDVFYANRYTINSSQSYSAQ